MNKPLMFSPELEQLIHKGKKTQTRRIVKPESGGEIIGWGGEHIAMEEISSNDPDTMNVRTVLCPYGKVGHLFILDDMKVAKITAIRVERLQDISDEDSIKEGCIEFGPFDEYRGAPHPTVSGNFRAYQKPKDAFKSVWEHIEGPDSWHENPWVWVISFELINSN
ncbi:TPA: hypothetical protein MW255_001046 [Acinetobacter baumannii]|nr:hypothetical protein [Acinetobacter baumannii]